MPLTAPLASPDLTAQGYELVTRHLVLPSDCHDFDGLFGGRLLEWLDEAGSIYCRYSMGMSRVVTRTMGAVDFASPARKSETVGIYCRLTRVGTTSLHMDIAAAVLDYDRGTERRIASLNSVWIGVGPDDKPVEWNKRFTGSIS